MHELGQLLKNARLQKGISLEDLQETTKIRKRYLEAIEEGNYKILPGNFYVRAFVKSYAEAVGLNPGEILSLYQNEVPAAIPDAQAEPLRRSGAVPKIGIGINWGRWGTGIMLWSFIILIIALLYYFLVQYKQSDTTAPKQTEINRLTDKTAAPGAGGAGAQKSPSPSASPSATPSPTPTPTPTPVVNVKLEKTEQGIDYYTVSQSDNMTVDLRIIGDASWVQVQNLNTKQNLQYNELTSGMVKNWTVNYPVFITLGRANAVELKLNGVAIPVGDAPNAKRFRFTLAAAPIQ